MDNDPKTFWVRAHMWQHIQVLHPVPAQSEEQALKKFREAVGDARDLVIEGVAEDPEELIGVQFGDQPTPIDDETPPDRTVH